MDQSPARKMWWSVLQCPAHWPLEQEKLDPSMIDQRTRSKSPDRPEQAWVLAHHSRYTGGGSSGVSPTGSNPHPVRARTSPAPQASTQLRFIPRPPIPEPRKAPAGPGLSCGIGTNHPGLKGDFCHISHLTVRVELVSLTREECRMRNTRAVSATLPVG